MPAFGLGTWLSKPGKVGAAVEAALKAGYVHIDCAHIYGNEVEVGEALQRCFKEGVCKREDIFVTSKLWNTSHAKDKVEESCKITLKNLQLDYLDLYLIHWPIDIAPDCTFPKVEIKDDERLGYSEERTAQCWEGMEGIVEKGLARAIGISNFTITKTANLLKTAKTVPAVNQVECHPFFQQQKLKEYCDCHGITFGAYSPLGNPGQLKQDNLERSVLDHPDIVEIAKKHSVSAAQVCVSFALHRGLVVIPKSVTPARIVENFKSVDVQLDADDMKKLREVDKGMRLLQGAIFYTKGQTCDEFWDVESDEKFEVKQPEAKKQRTGDDE
jgi:diketogulonate reductase-like aldo/keto reductase